MKDHYGHEAGEFRVDCPGCNKATGAIDSMAPADIWDAAIEAAAHGLETAIEYQWNARPRRPNNYRRAAQDVRGTPNPYRRTNG